MPSPPPTLIPELRVAKPELLALVAARSVVVAPSPIGWTWWLSPTPPSWRDERALRPERGDRPGGGQERTSHQASRIRVEARERISTEGGHGTAPRNGLTAASPPDGLTPTVPGAHEDTSPSQTRGRIAKCRVLLILEDEGGNSGPCGLEGHLRAGCKGRCRTWWQRLRPTPTAATGHGARRELKGGDAAGEAGQRPQGRDGGHG
jgi:hypothetical protein